VLGRKFKQNAADRMQHMCRRRRVSQIQFNMAWPSNLIHSKCQGSKELRCPELVFSIIGVALFCDTTPAWTNDNCAIPTDKIVRLISDRLTSQWKWEAMHTHLASGSRH